MPIYNAQFLEVDVAETKRYAGVRKKIDFPQERVDEACLDARTLVKPKGIWQVYDYDCNTQTVFSDTPVVIQGKSIGKHLAGCSKVVVLSATVGEDIENEVTASFNDGRYVHAMLLDAAATASVEQVADAMEVHIKSYADKQGLSMKWRFSPGYGDWPMTQQPEMMVMSKANEIGVELTDSMMLEPRKSITAIIGLYAEDNEQAIAVPANHDCSQCNKTDCIARKND